MKIGKIKLEKIKTSLSKVPRALAEKTFLTFLGLLIIFLIFGAFLFYKYVFLAENIKPEGQEPALQLKEGLLKNVLLRLEDKQRKFEETDSKIYPNPFSVPPVEVSAEEELTP